MSETLLFLIYKVDLLTAIIDRHHFPEGSQERKKNGEGRTESGGHMIRSLWAPRNTMIKIISIDNDEQMNTDKTNFH